METIERLLREEFQDPESTIVLDRAIMLARVRRGRRRRNARNAVAAAVLAVAGGSAFGVQAQFAGQPSPTTQAESGGVYTTVEGIGFANRDTGFVLVTACLSSPDQAYERFRSPQGVPSTPNAPECRRRLIATADGGRTWRDRNLPADLGVFPSGTRVIQQPPLLVLGDKTLVLRLGADDQRWMSSDAGLSWQQRDATGRATVATVPPDVPLIRRSQEPGDTAATQLAVVNRDGSIANLDTGPTDVRITVGPSARDLGVAATDGSRWLTGVTATNQGRILVSRDAGRTWQTIQSQPTTDGQASLTDISTIDGRTVSVISRSRSADEATEVVKVFRSSDSGVTWSTSPIPPLAPATENRLVHGVMGAVLQDSGGDVLAAVDGSLYLLPPNGRAYVQIAHAPKDIVSLSRSGPWLVATTFDRMGSRPLHDRAFVHISLDGYIWTDVHLP
jgi:hypothetical protein